MKRRRYRLNAKLTSLGSLPWQPAPSNLQVKPQTSQGLRLEANLTQTWFLEMIQGIRALQSTHTVAV